MSDEREEARCGEGALLAEDDWGSGAERGAASFALVSEEGGTMAAGIEMVLRDGRRLRISKGVEEETLGAVLAAMEP